MDSRENEALKEIIQNLEKTLRHRIVLAAKRSQETLIDELEALDLIIDLEEKLHL